jgi:O-antigen/teichoic acid export membrane protein
MRISKGFIKSSLIYSIAGMLPMASAIILLPFYLKYLSADDNGALSIYLAFSLLIQVITTYSFDTSLYIHYQEYKNDPKKLSSFVSSAFVLMLIIGGGVALVLFVIGDFVFARFLQDKQISFYPYGILAAATGIFQSLLRVHSYLLQSREKPELYFWSNLISFFLIAMFTIIGLELYPNSLIGPIGGRLLGIFVAGAWAIGRIFSEFGVHFNYPLLRSSFEFNLYAFIYQLQQWIINYFDRFVMLFYITRQDVGVYDFAIKCCIIIEFLMTGIMNTFFPKAIHQLMSHGNKQTTPEVNRYYHGFISVIMLLICLSILVIPPAIDIFVKKPDWRMAIPYVPLIASLYVFRTLRLYFALPYSSMKYTKPLPLVYTGVVVVKLLLMVLLLDDLKIYGVIMASAASAIADVVLIWLMMKNKFHYLFNPFKVLVAPLLLWAVIVAGEIFVADDYLLLARVAYLLICVALLWWVYRNEIKTINPAAFIRWK